MKEFQARFCPIYINCRDRVSDLRRLVAWLEEAGHENIKLLDNQSSYPPLLEFYEKTNHEVIYLPGNFGSRALWQGYQVPDEFFVLSDPDTIPLDECPYDAVSYLHWLLEAHPYPKAALGLYLDDVPADMESLAWERSEDIRGKQLRKGVRESLADTTFALYRPNQKFVHQALRTDHPYQCRHTTWYRWDEPTEEEAFYLRNCVEGPLGSSWAQSLNQKARRRRFTQTPP
jgi:hypothetical protein